VDRRNKGSWRRKKPKNLRIEGQSKGKLISEEMGTEQVRGEIPSYKVAITGEARKD